MLGVCEVAEQTEDTANSSRQICFQTEHFPRVLRCALAICQQMAVLVHASRRWFRVNTGERPSLGQT